MPRVYVSRAQDRKQVNVALSANRAIETTIKKRSPFPPIRLNTMALHEFSGLGETHARFGYYAGSLRRIPA